jgi:hypothetical protein
VEDWSFVTEKQNFLWLVAIAVTVCQNSQNDKWLRWLLLERVPKVSSNLQLRLFLRTGDLKYIPTKFTTDRQIASLIGNWKLVCEYPIRIKYFGKQTVNPTQRKRGYTDGRGSLDLSTNRRLFVQEYLSDYESGQLQLEIERVRKYLQNLEESLVSLSRTGIEIPSD